MLLQGYMHTAILCGGLGRGGIIGRVTVGSRTHFERSGDRRWQACDGLAARRRSRAHCSSADQRIAQLKLHGVDTTAAEEVLALFEEALEVFRSHRDSH